MNEEKLEKLKSIDILLAEDSPGDADLAKEALEESKLKNRLYTVVDGQEALDFLYKKGKYIDVPRPDLILLDLNMPKVDGREVLKIVKEDENLRSIPIVVLTTSRAEEDILKSYNLHANCYISKPLNLDKFIEVVNSIENFWISIVTLPQK
ncbi:MAG: response regulator [Bacteroidetes bacterium]|nr:response regulator [Bacteroidota bacterium]MBU1577851.1 response regulator [Bacteroidota bacterium]MBU2558829.1 response regulator [Bacteroidota bacterium]